LSIKHILIIRPCAIGDLIITLPTLHALREHFPNSSIEIMGYPSYLELVHGRFYADAISRFDHPDISILFRKDAQIPNSLTKKLLKFDLVIAFISDKDKTFTQNLYNSGAKKVLCHEPFPEGSGSIHIIDHLLNSLKLLEIPYSNSTPYIYLTKEDLMEGENFLRINERNTGQKMIAIHPGSGSTHKCWSLANYFSIIQWLTEHPDAQIFIITGPADTVIHHHISKLSYNNICVINNQPLPKLTAVLQRCDLFIGNDSGITHLAAAVGIPTIAIFGPTDPDVWGPKGKSVKICHHSTPCSPCSDEERKTCFPKTCLDSITTKSIREEISRFLSVEKLG